MSLVTRCPACGTVFRVVQDQLKVSEGWVRCGRCSDVFNAVDGLFNLDHDDNAAPDSTAVHDGTPAFAQDERSTLGAASASRVDALMAAVTETKADGGPPAVAAVDLVEPTSETAALAAAYAQLRPGDPWADAPLPDPPDSEIDGAPFNAPLAEAATATPDAALPTPEFVRRADQAARWQHPAVRSAMLLLCLLLAGGLAAQLALHYRDGLAANWPASQPWLNAACGWVGCSVDAPRRIDVLSVDSSGLLSANGGGQYRLSLVLHNRSANAVLMPAIDLALTDIKGQTMIRRVLYARDLGQPATTLAAQSEVAMQGLFDVGERRIAGYTVELFYP